MNTVYHDTDEAEPRRRKPLPKIIGLTGGIGSGKSTVAQFIMDLGYPVYNSDLHAKALVNSDIGLKQKIKELLGSEAYDKAGNYNRKWVASIVFDNETLLQQLNNIIHPAVRIDFQNWLSTQQNTLVFQETALLFENHLNEYCYKSILVTASQNLRIKRVMERDGKTYREVENIIEQQMSERRKAELADYIIENNDTLASLQQATHELLEKLEKVVA